MEMTESQPLMGKSCQDKDGGERAADGWIEVRKSYLMEEEAAR
jgi:hypothetical protein